MASPGSGTFFAWDPPLKEFNYELDRFAAGISDFSDLFVEIGGLFKADMGTQFASEGSVSGAPWAPLTKEYAARKAAKWPGRTIGWASGKGMESLTGGPGYTEIITPMTAEFGQADDATATDDGSYMAFFDKGWNHSSDSAGAPARPILRFTEQWGRDYSRLTAAWVRAWAHHAGLIGTGAQLYNQPLSALSFSEALPSD